MLMLKILPRIFFFILRLINVFFFAFIVYTTFISHEIDSKVYIYATVFYLGILIFHGIGMVMYRETLHVIEESYINMVEDVE